MTRPPRDPDPVSEYPSPTITDSRRLMGPNLLHAGLGAVLDVSVSTDATRNDALLAAWHARARSVAAALNWPDIHTVQRVYHGGASLFLAAPIDQLMTGTDVCETSWVFAESFVDGSVPSDAIPDAVQHSVRAGTQRRGAEQRALWNEAQRRGVNCLFDDDRIGVGSGIHAQTWALEDTPDVGAIAWDAVRDIPIVLVTGSNGKTTVVRMIAAMARAAGHTVGYTCTDGVWIGNTQVESGDYSGPGGARRVLWDSSVTFAVLESARGGILRRGLAVQHASIAAIVTLAADHLGDYGITTLAELAQAKLVVTRALHEHGTLIYNADIPALRDAVAAYSGHAVSVSQEAVSHSFRTEAQRDREEQGKMERREQQQQSQEMRQEQRSHADHLEPAPTGTSPILRASVRTLLNAGIGMTAAEINEIPATLHGAATHNVLNALFALTIANEMKLSPEAISALKRFGAEAADNMGRLMVRQLGGVTVVIDYAHNAQSVEALIQATSGMPAVRRVISLSTGGDRDDVALREIAAAAHQSQSIDLYIAKEMPKFLRGRPSGSISGVILDALRTLGVSESQITSAPDDMAATRLALLWSAAGDLLLLTIHDQRAQILALLDALAATAWQAGQPLPV
jgi:cyanophycin synthetase